MSTKAWNQTKLPCWDVYCTDVKLANELDLLVEEENDQLTLFTSRKIIPNKTDWKHHQLLNNYISISIAVNIIDNNNLFITDDISLFYFKYINVSKIKSFKFKALHYVNGDIIKTISKLQDIQYPLQFTMNTGGIYSPQTFIKINGILHLFGPTRKHSIIC